jgi:type II secretory pathway pseudopilin PulG
VEQTVRNRMESHSIEWYKRDSCTVCLASLGPASPRRAGFNTPGLSRKPRGFTLVEVVVAAAVLIILIIGLSGVFARGVNGFKQAQLMTLGQNLAEFLVEDVKNLAPSVLNQLVLGEDAFPPIGYQNVNYPYPTRDPSAASYDAVARANDHYPWMYDSGKLQTDFKVDGVMTIVGTETTFVAGTTDMPQIPSAEDVLLGSNVVVERYGVGEGTAAPTYWEDSHGWYYWSGETHTDWQGVPPAGTIYYYRIVLQKEAYPQFSRQVRIAEYDRDTPPNRDVWSPSLESLYRTRQGDTRTKYEYEVSIWYTRNGVNSILYRTGGTVGSPF